MKLQDCINLHLAMCTREVFKQFEGQLATPTLLWDVCGHHEKFIKALHTAVDTLSFADVESDPVVDAAWRETYGEEARKMFLNSQAMMARLNHIEDDFDEELEADLMTAVHEFSK